MAAFSRYNILAYDLLHGYHHWHAAGDVLKVMLTAAAIIATNAVKADVTEISAGNGYTAGGNDIQNDITQATNVATLTGVDVTITASGGSIGPWRSWVLYNDTQTTPVKPLIGGWDNTVSTTTTDGSTATLDFGAAVFTLTVT